MGFKVQLTYRSRRWTTVCAAALFLAATAVVFPVRATNIPVSVFNFPGLNGSGTSCPNENANLLSIVDVLPGYTVDGSIENFATSPTGEFADLLDQSRFFFMTDMEGQDPESTSFFPVAAQQKLESWVDEGGVLVMTGTANARDNTFLNLVFDWDLGRTTGSTWAKNTTNTAGTPFDPISGSLPAPSATDGISRGTVENFKAMWGDDSNATVAVIRYGNGYVIFLGYDFYNTGAANSSFRGNTPIACPANSNVWVQDILPAALAYATQLSDSRLSDITQTSAKLTYSFSSTGTTSLIVVASGSTAPTATEVKAQADYGAVTLVSAQQVATTGGVDRTFSFSGLTASTNYVIYVVTEYDDNGTPTLSAVTSIPFSTIAVGEAVRGSGPSTPTPTASGRAPEPVADPGGGLPEVTPGSSTGSVGGVPVVPTPARRSAGEADFRVGTVETRLDVAVAGAGRVGGSSSAPVLEVVRDRVATLAGGGMRPGGIAQVWMPLPGGGSRQVAVLPIAEDGTFDGALPFTGELDGRGPLPIGERTIQLFGTGADGQLTVINVGIRIEQPGPLAPEPERAPGAPPTLTPGQSLGTVAGLPTSLNVTPRPDANSTRIEGDGWIMDVDVPEGTVRDQGGAPLIEIVNGTDSQVRGTGFMPGTRAYVWLMSDPTFLGEVTVGADGSFSGLVPVDGVTTGEHTLQLSGVGTDGYVRAANLGVVVTGGLVPTRVPAGDGPIGLTPGGSALIGMLAATALFGLGTRRRRQHAGRLN